MTREMRNIALAGLLCIAAAVAMLSCIPHTDEPLPRLTLEQQMRVTAWAETE